MATKADVLSPHHLGEALVAGLLQTMAPDAFAALAVLDPRDGAEKRLSEALPRLVRKPSAIHRASPLEVSDGRTFDGMHELDCALVCESDIVGVELKLGTSGMGPGAFRRKFVTDESAENTPRMRGERVDGSMIAFLEWNGRAGGVLQPSLRLKSRGAPVAQEWLLVVVEDTLLTWRKCAQLGVTLGTQQLVGVLSLETVGRAVGPGEAKRLAKTIASAEIDRWKL